jgi:hypothetical protein
MDKTGVVRKICSRVLFAALTIQALTPDALDLTLLANHRLPGPVLVLMSVLAEERDEEDETRRAAAADAEPFSSLSRSSPRQDPSDPPSDNVMQPLWPEVGLSRNLNRPIGLISHLGSTWQFLLIDGSLGRREGRSDGRGNPGKDFSHSTCRMTC